MRNVIIALARCSRKKQMLGLRFERVAPKKWIATWAFNVKESVAKREGFTPAKVEGTFNFGETFPGCTHCGNKGFFCCECGNMSCYSPENSNPQCPWCGLQLTITGSASSLSAGGDR